VKKLLVHLDTDPHPSVFDVVVAYDGGVEHVISLAGMRPESVAPPVDGAIFTRPPRSKRRTAIFVGGSDLDAGEALLSAVESRFFSGFRVSVMLDSNGANTTAAAAIALLRASGPLTGTRSLVLGGTGPVGRRSAALLALEGAEVSLASRSLERARAACSAITARFGVVCHPVESTDLAATAALAENVELLLAAGAPGATLLDEAAWRAIPELTRIADLNTSPPAGIGGVALHDRATDRAGKVTFGGIGVGALKLRVQRACIDALFERNDQVFDAEAILAIAKSLATQT